MRVHSTFEVNTNYQQNPFITQHAGSTSTTKTAPGISFDECLRSHFQQVSAPAPSLQSKTLIAGFVWGYHPSLREPTKLEPTLKGST